MTEPASGASRGAILSALTAVYIVWGSTYLAIRFAVETLPPFLMAGVRFTVAGTILYVWRRAQGHVRPTGPQWRAAVIVGALMLLVGNGGVVWAEQWVESGTAALLVASVPLWMVLLEWLRPGGRSPLPSVWVGVPAGLIGVALLMGSPPPTGGRQYTIGLVVLVLASVAWAIGSLYSRSAVLPAPLMATGMQMLTGGILLLLVGTLAGELVGLDPATISLRSSLALLYLILFGSLIGFTSYIWLLRVTPPAIASTYAFVNPVVAVFLGWLLAGERITPRILLASAVIVGGVAVITTARARRRPPTAAAADATGTDVATSGSGVAPGTPGS